MSRMDQRRQIGPDRVVAGPRSIHPATLRAGPGGRMVHGMAPYKRTTRRSFIKSTGTVATALWTTGPAILRAQTGDKLRLAIIGCGGRGRANLKGVASEHIAALCDVDKNASTRPPPSIRRRARRWTSAPLRPSGRVRRRRGQATTEHTHAFRHAARPAAQEARVLREAAGLQRAADRIIRRPRPCRGRHADGHAGARQRQLPPAWWSWCRPAPSGR